MRTGPYEVLYQFLNPENFDIVKTIKEGLKREKVIVVDAIKLENVSKYH